MKVLIFGASGFIGNGVALAFTRAGHLTYGQSRSYANAKSFAADEIVPIICDPLTKEGREMWGPIAATADVVIDCTSLNTAEKALSLVSHFKAVIADRSAVGPKPTYIYTGGLWSLTREGDGLEGWTDERQPRTGLNTISAWRKHVEDPVLAEEKFNGVVIRPPMLYGQSGSFVGAMVFEPAYQAAKHGKPFEAVFKGDTRWLTIHPDDLGEAYRLIAEIGHLAKGQTFLPANPQSERLTDILDAIVRVSGAKGWKGKNATTSLEKAWVSTTKASPSLITAMTGWRPRKLGLVDGIDIYWEAWLAARQE